MKILKFFAIGTLCLLSLTCKTKSSDKVEIRFWAMGVEGEKVSQLVPEFEQRNPGITVKIQQVPWTAAHEKLITAFASETLPDVFQLGNTWVPEFQNLRAIEPLTAYIASSSSLKKDFFFDGIWETNVLDKTPYGIPWYVDTRLLFYRKSILEKAGYKNPPQTWDELLDASQKIKKNDPKHYAFFLPTNEWAPFVIFGMQGGSELLRDGGRYGDFSGAAFKKSYNYLMKFYNDGLAPKDMTQVLNLYQAFEEGYFSMYITGPWNITEFKNRLPADMQDDWMTAPLPSEKKGEYPGVSTAGGATLVLNSHSTHKDAAWKWIEFLSEKETQLKFYRLVSALPSVITAWNDPELHNDKYLQAFYTQLTKTKPTPQIPEWEQIVIAKIQQYVEFTATGKMSVDEALQRLDQDVNLVLEKRRWIISKTAGGSK